ncbi:MAG: hypothetical protein H0X28_05815 [Solirubrobacterales bacterium]|nr:hypothetical protein [Solirubrobacterales bacterium]
MSTFTHPRRPPATLGATGVLAAVLSSTVTSMLSLVCVNFSGPEGAAVRALSTKLSAIQANTIV